jgi:hypothetical protein
VQSTKPTLVDRTINEFSKARFLAATSRRSEALRSLGRDFWLLLISGKAARADAAGETFITNCLAARSLIEIGALSFSRTDFVPAEVCGPATAERALPADELPAEAFLICLATALSGVGVLYPGTEFFLAEEGGSETSS